MKSWKLQRACANSSWHRLPQGLTRTRSNCKGFAGAEKWSHLRHFTKGHSQLGSVKGLKHPSRPISTGRQHTPLSMGGIHRPISLGRHTHVHYICMWRQSQARISGLAHTGPYLWGGIHKPMSMGGTYGPISMWRQTQAISMGGTHRPMGSSVLCHVAV